MSVRAAHHALPIKSRVYTDSARVVYHARPLKFRVYIGWLSYIRTLYHALTVKIVSLMRFNDKFNNGSLSNYQKVSNVIEVWFDKLDSLFPFIVNMLWNYFVIHPMLFYLNKPIGDAIIENIVYISTCLNTYTINSENSLSIIYW